ncbi:MAG: hypothetical protein ACYCW6_12755 [Candidatus Xenobia bacterium]
MRTAFFLLATVMLLTPRAAHAQWVYGNPYIYGSPMPYPTGYGNGSTFGYPNQSTPPWYNQSQQSRHQTAVPSSLPEYTGQPDTDGPLPHLKASEALSDYPTSIVAPVRTPRGWLSDPSPGPSG